MALFGALFSARLTDLLGSGAAESMTPSQISQLAAGERAQMAGAYADAITGVFLVAVPVLLLGFALTWFLREVPLRTSTSRADDAGPAPLDAAVTDELAPRARCPSTSPAPSSSTPPWPPPARAGSTRGRGGHRLHTGVAAATTQGTGLPAEREAAGQSAGR